MKVSKIGSPCKCMHSYLDCCINAADGEDGQARMAFDDIYNTAIAFVYAMQPSGVFIPEEEIAIVGTRSYKLVFGADKIDLYVLES